LPTDAVDWPTVDTNAFFDVLPRGTLVDNPGPMFTRIDDDMLAAWKARFPGG